MGPWPGLHFQPAEHHSQTDAQPLMLVSLLAKSLALLLEAAWTGVSSGQSAATTAGHAAVQECLLWGLSQVCTPDLLNMTARNMQDHHKMHSLVMVSLQAKSLAGLLEAAWTGVPSGQSTASTAGHAAMQECLLRGLGQVCTPDLLNLTARKMHSLL